MAFCAIIHHFNPDMMYVQIVYTVVLLQHGPFKTFLDKLVDLDAVILISFLFFYLEISQS